MQDLRYDIDPQGDTILVLRCPNTNQPVWEPTDQVSKLKQKNTIRRRMLFGSAFMPDTEDGRSDDENAHEPTPEPVAHTIESNVPNDTDSTEAHGEDGERNEVQFRLCSRHLALASPVFKTMLNGSWKESSPPSDQSHGSAKTRAPTQNGTDCQVRYELAATEWDAEDFLLLMNIVHGRNRQVPYSVDLETLGRIAVLVDYYQCQEVTQFVAEFWIDKIYYTFPATYGRNCVTWMFVSWVFTRGEFFEKMTLLAIRTCEGGLGTINLPFPPMLLTVMEQKRDRFIDEIFEMLGDVGKDLWKGHLGCDFACRSMMLGSLLGRMDKNELYGACSAEGAKSAALSLKSESWCSLMNGRHCSSHTCTLYKLLQPGIERLWDGLDGLKLCDYNGQNE